MKDVATWSEARKKKKVHTQCGQNMGAVKTPAGSVRTKVNKSDDALACFCLFFFFFSCQSVSSFYLWNMFFLANPRPNGLIISNSNTC